MRVAVLGSSSFAGSDFVELLLSKKHYEVLGVSRSKARPPAFLPENSCSTERFTPFQFDINRDLEEIVATLLSFEPQYVVNFAAQGDETASWAHPADFFQTNCVALARLVDRLKDGRSIRRFLQVSTSGVYGNPGSMISEESPLRPETPYSSSKAAADNLLLGYTKTFGFPVQIVRPPNLYGPYQQLFRIIPKTFVSLKRGIPIELHGGGRSVRSYLHVRDASRGILTILERGRVGEAYNIGPNHLTCVRDIVAVICELLGQDFAESTIDVQDRRNQSTIAGFSSSKIRHELGWFPEVSLLEGIQEVGTWIEREWNHLIQAELVYTHIQ